MHDCLHNSGSPCCSILKYHRKILLASIRSGATTNLGRITPLFLLRQRDVRQVLPVRNGLVFVILTGFLGLLGVDLAGVGDEGDNRVFPECEVDDSQDVDEHEREDDGAYEHIAILGQRVVDEPPHEARAQEVHVDADDQQAQQP
jgi:hypothetical protein